ncbi:MAG TPA: diguanylate cyclase, partial [Bryobacterales bacterium]|nr:diguanylate cyclase [Bryobacterales bacterium]
IRLPGMDRAVSLSFAFRFAAIMELPVDLALFVVCVSLIYQALRDASGLPRWMDLGFSLGAAAVSTLATHKVYLYLAGRVGVEPLLALGVAAIAYYGASSVTNSIYIGFQSRTAPWKIWSQQFFWIGPLYLLVPVAAAITEILKRATGTSDRLLGLGLIFGGYRYVKYYFGRLHDRQDHFQRMDDIRQRTIESLAVAIEAKDGATAGHLQRVRRHAVLLAKKLSFSEMEVKTLELGALLHDVGKVGVPDYLLGKPGRLTEEEFSQIAVHTQIGADIVTAVDFPYPVEEVVMCHHEHWDGSGYPRQLCGPGIPRLARVLTVVDCFDALVVDRPYRAALPVDKAVEVMREQRGKLFDPEILDMFLQELPTFSADLERELKIERARLLLDQSPVQRVKQTWLTDAESNETALRRMTFERLAETPEQLVLLYDILQVLGSSLEVHETMKQTLELLERVIPHEQGGVFAVEDRQYVLIQGRGIPEHCISRLAVPVDHGTLANAATAQKAILAPGPPAELTTGLHKYLLNVRSTLAAPIVADGKVLGAIALCSSRSDAFNQEQAWFLGLITPKLAAMIAAAQDVQKLKTEAATDPLTAVPNARATFQRLEMEVERARREDAALAVLFLDLNHFKHINDTYGHGAGDRMLVQTADRLKTCLRAYDFLGRLGGDEFLAILPGMGEENIWAKVASLKKAVDGNVVTLADGTEVSASVSIGLALYPKDARSVEDLIYRSDKRMYVDKKKSREAPDVAESPGVVLAELSQQSQLVSAS